MRNELFLSTMMVLGCMTAFGKDGIPVREQEHSAFRTTTFETPQGSITVYTSRTRGTFTGAVLTEPRGKTDREIRKNTSMLGGYVLEVNEQKAKVASGVFHYVAPAARGAAEFMILKDPSGKPVTTPSGHPLWRDNPNGPEPYRIWEQPESIEAPPTTPSGAKGWRDNPNGPEPYRLFYRPAVAQAGEPLAISGTFNGSFSNTRADVGRQTAELLLETENQLVVKCPEDVVGPAALTVREGEQVSTSDFRAVAISLSAPQPTLQRGEHTTLIISGKGLENLDQPLEVELTSSKSIHISGGDQQVIQIQPWEVQPDGTFTAMRDMVGGIPGAFSIHATLRDGGSKRK